MKIDYEGKTRELDINRIRLKQAEKIQAYTQLPLSKWAEALTKEDHPAFLKAYAALYWLMLSQNDEATGVGIGDVDFELTTYANAFGEASAAEAATEPADSEPDPTRPAVASQPSSEPPSRHQTARSEGDAGQAPDG